MPLVAAACQASARIPSISPSIWRWANDLKARFSAWP